MVEHIDELMHAADSIENRFYAVGSVQGRPITLQVDNSISKFPMSLGDAPKKLQKLLAQARPSPFGR